MASMIVSIYLRMLSKIVWHFKKGQKERFCGLQTQTHRKYVELRCLPGDDCNATQTHNHLVCKWTLNHLAKLTLTHSSTPSPSPPLLHIGRWDFSKMAVMGGGNGNFLKKVSSQSWQRGDNPFYEDYPYIAYPPLPPPFSNIVHPTSPFTSHFPVTSHFPSLSSDIWCAILLNHNMGLHMLSLSIFSPEGPWCVFHATRHQVYWGLTHNVAFYWYSEFI